MKDKRKSNKYILFPNEYIQKIISENYYKKSIQDIDNSDVNINHLENIFSNELYYLAMKIVPLIERKVLYLTYVENCKLIDICRRLKMKKKRVISLREKGIRHFKYNLQTLYQVNNLKNKITAANSDFRTVYQEMRYALNSYDIVFIDECHIGSFDKIYNLITIAG